MIGPVQAGNVGQRVGRILVGGLALALNVGTALAGSVGDSGGGSTAAGNYAWVGGGNQNHADGAAATISGGDVNRASGNWSTVGGGSSNLAEGLTATISGGNRNSATNGYSTIAGGQWNNAAGYGATVGGGEENKAGRYGSTGADYATVGGGYNNTAQGTYSAIAGGANNQALGAYSAIPGGRFNVVATSAAFGIAAGFRATVQHKGAFVWSDYGVNKVFASTANNEFAARATGGVRFVSAVNATTGAPTAGVRLRPGSGSWANLSDRDSKTAVAAVDGRDILRRLVSMPVSTWSYKTEGTVRHIGPTAQDFHAAFGVGPSETEITSVDADGVALAAIQGLHAELKARDAEIAKRDQQVADLTARLERLEALIAGIAGQHAALQ